MVAEFALITRAEISSSASPTSPPAAFRGTNSLSQIRQSPRNPPVVPHSGHFAEFLVPVPQVALQAPSFGFQCGKLRFIGPRTPEQLAESLRALDVSLSDETLRRLNEILPCPGGEAPNAYAW